MIFKFKQFGMRHDRSSMKIGVDGVLTGAWGNVYGCRHILDAGTGCGVIAMMCAQRNKDAIIDAIDIDEASVNEAKENFIQSPWPSRLKAQMRNFSELSREEISMYDLIISNPPYFDSGIKQPDSSRLKARHKDSLSPEIIIFRLSDEGKNGAKSVFIIPIWEEENLYESISGLTIRLIRRTIVKGLPHLAPKRVLLEFEKQNSSRFNTEEAHEISSSELILEQSPGKPTEDYRQLCADFYIKF